jgi:hypothetical protein
MHIVSKYGYIKLCELLLEYNFDLNAEDLVFFYIRLIELLWMLLIFMDN